MNTTDLQRLRQDEWLADLLSTEDEQGVGACAFHNVPFCVLGRAREAAGLRRSEAEEVYDATAGWLGISYLLLRQLWERNDGSRDGSPSEAFPAIAGWFKEQRDLWDGDLSNWTPAQ